MKRFHVNFLNTFLLCTLLLFIFLTVSLPQAVYSYENPFDLRGKISNTWSVQAQEKRELRRENREARLQERNERIERKEAFKDELASLKDQNKKELIERINRRLAQINTNHTTMLLSVLSKFEVILSRIIEKTHNLASEGINTASIDADITDAEVAIADAKEAIQTQSDKDYTLDISGGSNLKESIKATRQLLHSDLKAVRELVKAAHKAVKIAAKSLHTQIDQK